MWEKADTAMVLWPHECDWRLPSSICPDLQHMISRNKWVVRLICFFCFTVYYEAVVHDHNVLACSFQVNSLQDTLTGLKYNCRQVGCVIVPCRQSRQTRGIGTRIPVKILWTIVLQRGRCVWRISTTHLTQVFTQTTQRKQVFLSQTVLGNQLPSGMWLRTTGNLLVNHVSRRNPGYSSTLCRPITV